FPKTSVAAPLILGPCSSAHLTTSEGPMPFARSCVVLVMSCAAAASACDSRDTPFSPTPTARPLTSPVPGPGGIGTGPLDGNAPATTITAGDHVSATIGREDPVCD